MTADTVGGVDLSYGTIITSASHHHHDSICTQRHPHRQMAHSSRKALRGVALMGAVALKGKEALVIDAPSPHDPVAEAAVAGLKTQLTCVRGLDR